MGQTLVLGVGNTLLSDEGVGVHTIAYLRSQHPDVEGVSYLDGGTLSFTLADAIAEADELIIVDATQLGADAGAIQCFVGEDMDRYLGTAKHSVHEVSLLDLLDMARLTDSMPARRALVGIQPLSLDWGDQPTEPVAQAIPKAAERVLELVQQWRSADPVS